MDRKRIVSNQRKPLNKCHSLKIAIAAETKWHNWWEITEGSLQHKSIRLL